MRDRLPGRNLRGLLGGLGVLIQAGHAADPPVSPLLHLEVSSPVADVLTWDQPAEGFYLEQSATLAPPRVWSPVEAPVTMDGTTAQVILPKGEGLRFFQLRHDLDFASLFEDYIRKLDEDLPLRESPVQDYVDVPFLDPFSPASLAPLLSAPHITTGGYVLTPGLWEVGLRTFCLKTGTVAPGGGDGYLPAAFAGPRADLIVKVLEGFSDDPEADQESTQILLWAMLVRAPIEPLPAPVRALASRWLTSADLDRLRRSAELKSALQAAYTGRLKRLLLGPGGLFEDLPPAVQDALQWDAEIEEALGRASEVSYEDLQELAFAASPPALPPDPPRDIPFGRWAWVPTSHTPPDGYLIRFVVLGYGETVVQFCLPEEITIETDALGRVTRLADLSGNEIRTTYDSGVPPLSIPGEAGLSGHAFDSIVLKGPQDPEDPRRLLETSHAGTGWVLTGVPGGGGTAGSGGRFDEAERRYAFALEQQAGLARLDTDLSRVHPGRPPGDAAQAGRLLNLAHYCEGLRLALLAAEPDDDPDFPYLADRLGLAYRAWLSEMARFGRGPAESQPADGVRSGSAGGRPRLKGSPVPCKSWEDWKWTLKDFGSRIPRALGLDKFFAKPASRGQQNVGISTKPVPVQPKSAPGLYDRFQELVKPIGHLFRFAKLPNVVSIPQKVIEHGLRWELDAWENATRAIEDPEGYGRTYGPKAAAADAGSNRVRGSSPAPATRTDYDVPTAETFWEPARLEPGLEITPARRSATEALLTASMRLTAHLQAATIAIERQYAAFRAQDAEWYRLQGAFAVYQARAAGLAMWDVAEAIEAWIKVLRDEGVEDPWVTRADLDEIQSRLRTGGYTAWEIEGFRMAGFTDAEIERCRQGALDWMPGQDGYGLFGSLEELTHGLRELGSWLTLLPVPFDPAAD